MDVSLSLKSWSVKKDSEKGLPKLCGKFAVMIGEKEIATQGFNDGYGEKDVPFSNDIVNRLIAFEEEIRSELARLLA